MQGVSRVAHELRLETFNLSMHQANPRTSAACLLLYVTQLAAVLMQNRLLCRTMQPPPLVHPWYSLLELHQTSLAGV